MALHVCVRPFFSLYLSVVTILAMADAEVFYPLDPEKVYYSMDELTLETPEGP